MKEEPKQEGSVPARIAVEEAFRTIEGIHNGSIKHTGVSSGFRDLDGITSGFRPESLVVLAGRESMGHRALALQFALNIASQPAYWVLHHSLTLSREPVALHLVRSEARVCSHKIQHGMLSDDEMSKLAKASATVSDSNLFIDDRPCESILQLVGRTAHFVSTRRGRLEKLGLVLVDPLENLRNLYESDVEALKGLAEEIDAPVLLICDLEDASEDLSEKTPRLDELKAFLDADYFADLVLFVHREVVYDPEIPEKDTADIMIAKNRHGTTGLVRLHYDWEHGRFEELDTSSETIGGRKRGNGI